MGYFSNGTEGDCYEQRYCQTCIHQNGPDGRSMCAVWAAHMLKNYDECNNDESILHMLIPRDGKGHNGICSMHAPKSPNAPAQRPGDWKP